MQVFLHIALLMCLWCPFCFAQAPTDTSGLLPTVVVSALPLRTTLPGERTEQWTQQQLSTYSHQSVADLLARESGLYLKTYGLGSLATLSSRGGSAGQTAVVWNGLPIQSPMLGLLDVAMMPAGFSDGLTVHYGGNSAQWGSGAVGGIVALHNQKPENQGFAFHYSGVVGSFGAQSHVAKVQAGGTRFSSITRLLWQKANNDFPYRKRPELPEIRQSNAHFQQKGLLQEFYWLPNRKNEIALRAWVQSSNRQIPPLTTQTRNEAWQADDFLRLGLHWKRTGGHSILTARTGYFTEYIDYQDPSIALSAKSHFNTALAEVEGQWPISNRIQLHAGTNHTLIHAFADGYRTPPKENRTAAFASMRFTHHRFEAQINARQAWQDGHITPFMPGIGAAWKPFNWLTVNLKSVKNYRQPTLNDRYWRPGGNPELLPESGWSHEMGMTIVPMKLLEYSATTYGRTMKNWILWSIREGQSYWSPNNITEVYSRGVEQRLQYTRKGHLWYFRLAVGYDYTRSTNQVALKNPRLAAGDQLLYIPLHQGFIRLQGQIKPFTATYQHRFTGSVKGINERVSEHNIGFCTIQYQTHFRKKHKVEGQASSILTFFLQVDNTWNTSYRVVERRPMPGRNFRVGASISSL